MADVCNPADFHGVYGFELTGTTTISGQPQAVVSVGRLVFDGGGITGVAAVSFTGLYLGNPVTGSYEAHEDCSVSWSLQDDSGNYQHFRGTMSANALRVQFHQSDSSGPAQGSLRKAAETCGESDFQPRYRFTLVGKRIDVGTGQVSGPVSLQGVVNKTGDELTVMPSTDSAAAGSGTFEVQDDCFVQLEFMLPGESGLPQEMNFRGILVDGGRELLGMATDPGTAVSFRLTAP